MHLKENVTPDDHSQGAEDAKVTLVEYGDYQCSDCGSAYPVVKRLQERFGESLRFTFRNFPLGGAHPMPESAAEAAEYAATKGKFWQMHDDLYEHQIELPIELLATLATKNGLNTKSLTEALVQQTFQDFIGGARSSVNGTPTFFINGIRHDGEADVETLAATIEQFL
jgi:protein-disulfide isomerase